MLTVTISINARPVYTRTVVNRLAERGAYVCDDGSLIQHDPADGAIVLAVKALQTIREVDERRCQACGRLGGMPGEPCPRCPDGE